MPVSTKKEDGRSKNSKGTTEWITLDMGGRALSIWRWTDNAKSKSRFWQVRCQFEKRIIQKSTGEEDIRQAREFAKTWYGGLLSRHQAGIPVKNEPMKFGEVAKSYFKRCERLVREKKRHKNYAKDAQIRYKNYLLPFFKKNFVYEINTPRINAWMKWREDHRIKTTDLRAGELKKELAILRAILNEAVGEGLIPNLPVFPPSIRVETISTKKTPARTYFNSKEMTKLLDLSRKRIKEAKQLVDNPPKTGGNYPKIYKDRIYLHNYIIFLAGTGMRPGEAQRVKHKDIREFKEDKDEDCHLSIDVIGKRGDRKVISKYGAYFAYQKLKKDVCPKDFKANDIVFPVSPVEGLKSLLIAAKLRENNKGERRDAKSFRHYYIMKALADGQDAWMLSVQCDVDPTIIKQHYARHMTSQQFKDELIKITEIELL